MLLLTVTLTVMALASGVAMAADLLDQQNPIPTDQGKFGAGVDQRTAHAQTFTAGLTGKLDKVSVYLTPNTSDPNAPGNVVAEIYPTNASGLPKTSATPLGKGSLSIPPNADSASFGWLDVPLSKRASVKKEKVYALVVRAVDTDPNNPGFGGYLSWRGANAQDNYTRGNDAESGDGTTWGVVAGQDYFFKTFVAKRTH
jgi:hypothetical protein